MAEMEKPKLKAEEVLIKNHYTSINPMDTQVRGGKFKLFAGQKFPKILGVESAGVVEEVGDQVIALKKGDRVMAALGFNFGTYAEFTKVNEKSVFFLPNDITFHEGETLTMAACTA